MDGFIMFLAGNALTAFGISFVALGVKLILNSL